MRRSESPRKEARTAARKVKAKLRAIPVSPLTASIVELINGCVEVGAEEELTVYWLTNDYAFEAAILACRYPRAKVVVSSNEPDNPFHVAQALKSISPLNAARFRVETNAGTSSHSV